ncbi:MAG: hypothetical protein K2M04_01915 [Muribaculaceae bacterium]|nr:hypothetical protein [Muribaculaceae bacterium]
MILSVPFSEISDYLRSHYNRDVTLSRITDDSFHVTFTQKILIKNVNIGLDLKIAQLDSESVTIIYSGSFAIDMILSGLLAFIIDNYPDIRNAVTVSNNDKKIRVDLTKIEKARKLLEILEPKAITVDDSAIALTATLR